MATLLEWVLEKHEGPEPRVLTDDVQAILRRVIKPGTPDDGEAVVLIADKARVSTRTVYRVLQNKKDPEKDEPRTISLDLADRLCLAANAHLSTCRLYWPDGSVTQYRGD
jgi:hypothetical protein